MITIAIIFLILLSTIVTTSTISFMTTTTSSPLQAFQVPACRGVHSSYPHAPPVCLPTGLGRKQLPIQSASHFISPSFLPSFHLFIFPSFHLSILPSLHFSIFHHASHLSLPPFIDLSAYSLLHHSNHSPVYSFTHSSIHTSIQHSTYSCMHACL